MKNTSSEGIFKSLEVISVIFLLLFAESLNASFIPSSLINILSYGIILILIVGRLKRFTYAASRDTSLILLIGVALASVYWSINPSDTAQEVRALLRSLFFSIYLAMQYTPKELIRLLSWVIGFALILSFFASLMFPSYTISSEPDNYSAWQGIFNHKQIFGRFLSFGSTIFISNLIAKKGSIWNNLSWLGFIFILLIFSQSKTGLIAYLLVLLFLPVYKIVVQKHGRALFLLIALLITSLLIILISLNIENIVVGYLGKNLEFNGRTPIWTMIIDKGLERPFLGYGYNAFWTSNESTFIIMNSWARGQEGFRTGQIIFHAHNGFLDLFLQLGLIGVILFTYNLLLTIIRIINLLFTTRQFEYFWMLQFLVVYLIFNLSEGQTLLSTSNILWIIYGFISLSSSIQYNRIKSNTAN
ncbi:O-antigen ligase family protein [Fortiea contorta]|uniref:O-antigen ligase family protein n=1 Tax=Fortiea contorta TaxID=1892405 RepID=UPI00034CBD7E|nr:O-antigen ligase family protein [Fortiea contorta]